jgi:hypothetical protein
MANVYLIERVTTTYTNTVPSVTKREVVYFGGPARIGGKRWFSSKADGVRFNLKEGRERLRALRDDGRAFGDRGLTFNLLPLGQASQCDDCAPGLRDRMGRCANHQEAK